MSAMLAEYWRSSAKLRSIGAGQSTVQQSCYENFGGGLFKGSIIEEKSC